MTEAEKHVSFDEKKPDVKTITDEERRRLPKRKTNFHEVELARVKAQLRLSGYIVQLTKRPLPPYTPNIWNDLHPYTRSDDLEFIMRFPHDQLVNGATRLTSSNIVDEEVNVKMDQTIPEHLPLLRNELLQKNAEKKKEAFMEFSMSEADQRILKLPQTVRPTPRKQKNGTTSLTPFPKINLRRPQVVRSKKYVDYADLATMRNEMRELLHERIQRKNNFEYTRTRDDFYRMEIDVARNRAGAMNRYLLDKACNVYFGTWKGSRDAYNDLVK